MTSQSTHSPRYRSHGRHNVSLPFQMLEHIRTTHQLDYIMISGDFPAHDVWLQSREHNLATATTVLQALQQVQDNTVHSVY